MGKHYKGTAPAPPELKPMLEKFRAETCKRGECLKVLPHEWDHLQETGESILLCQRCEVANQCLVQALVYEAGSSYLYRYEMWGGTTPEERFMIDITAAHGPNNDKIARNKILIELRKQNIHLKHEKEKAEKQRLERLKAGEQQLW